MPLVFDEAFYTDGGAGFRNYRDFPHFRQRAQWLAAYLPPSAKVLEFGCAYGYVVGHAQGMGVTITGIDKSVWAVGQADAIAGDDVVQASAATYTIPSNITHIFSWYFLDSLDSETEAEVVATNLCTSSAEQIHVIPCDDESNSAKCLKEHGYLTLPLSYWQTLFAEHDVTLVDYNSRQPWQWDGHGWVERNGLLLPLSWGLVSA